MHGLEGLDFGAATNFAPTQEPIIQGNSNQEKKTEQIFNLPPIENSSSLDQFTIRELCDPIISVIINN